MEPQLEALAAGYQAATQAAADNTAIKRIILTGIVLAVIVAATFAWIIGGSVSDAVVDMTGRVGKLAGGNLEVEVSGLERQCCGRPRLFMIW